MTSQGPRLGLLSKLLRNEIHIKAVRSRGPGGQNVNKVSSAAVLTWNLTQSNLFTQDELERLMVKLSSRINQLGEIQIRSEAFRDLPRNKEKCFEKLLSLLEGALTTPKIRKPTSPTLSSKRKRVDSKKKRSEIKQGRRKLS